MSCKTGKFSVRMGGLFVALLALTAFASTRRKPPEPPFQYAAGTERVAPSCGGNLEVTADALVFKCPSATLSMRFASIDFMEYRSDISKRVRKLGLPWQVELERRHPRRNRYFTVVYKQEAAATHVVVLKVSPTAMRPYLAEIELKSGKRVEVMGYEDYE